MVKENENKRSQRSYEEEYSQKAIPESMKKHWMYPASVFLGMCAVLISSMAGGGLISGLTFVQAILAMVLGLVVLLVAFYIPLGKIGASEGVNTYVLGECAFGKMGSNIATSLLVTILPAAAWYGVGVSVATQALASVIPMSKAAFNIVTIILGILFATPAAFGILSMAWLNWLSLPVMAFVIVFGVGKALSITGMPGILAYTPEQNLGLLWGMNLQIGMITIGCCSVADYTRWIKDENGNVTKSGVVGLFPATMLLAIAGMMMALTSTQAGVTETWNIVQVMMSIGMPSLALILVFLLQWTTSITSSYSSGLALQKIFGGSRFVLTYVFAGLGTVFALSNIISKFMDFVTLLASWVPPIAGVMIAEYYFVSEKNFNSKEKIYWPGLISAAIGGFISWKFTFFIPAVNGLIIGGLVYYLYHKITGKCKSKEAIEDATV